MNIILLFFLNIQRLLSAYSWKIPDSLKNIQWLFSEYCSTVWGIICYISVCNRKVTNWHNTHIMKFICEALQMKQILFQSCDVIVEFFWKKVLLLRIYSYWRLGLSFSLSLKLRSSVVRESNFNKASCQPILKQKWN